MLPYDPFDCICVAISLSNDWSLLDTPTIETKIVPYSSNTIVQCNSYKLVQYSSKKIMNKNSTQNNTIQR